MCGFVGTTNKHMTSLMLDKQSHRGPDDRGYWSDGRISFGHALLDITGAAQTQPYITPEGNIVMLNGEIYDSPEQNDTAWLGKLLDKYGINTADKKSGKNIIPKLYGALIKNEQDVGLFEQLAFMSRNK